MDAAGEIKTQMRKQMTRSGSSSESVSDRTFTETHDLFLRAIAVPVENNGNKKRETRDIDPREAQATDEPKWIDSILAFDTESRITVDQSLTFGVWRRGKLVGRSYELVEDGIFYADDLPARDLK